MFVWKAGKWRQKYRDGLTLWHPGMNFHLRLQSPYEHLSEFRLLLFESFTWLMNLEIKPQMAEVCAFLTSMCEAHIISDFVLAHGSCLGRGTADTKLFCLFSLQLWLADKWNRSVLRMRVKESMLLFFPSTSSLNATTNSILLFHRGGRALATWASSPLPKPYHCQLPTRVHCINLIISRNEE